MGQDAVRLAPLLAAALLVPFAVGADAVPGGQDSQETCATGAGVDRLKERPSHTQIPAEPDDLAWWFADNTDAEKKALAREKQAELSDALFPGGLAGEGTIPVTGIGYDYVDNALEVTVEPAAFAGENVGRYIDAIRGIVGNCIDVTVAPAEYAVPSAAPPADGYPEYEKMYNFRLEVVYVFPESVERLVERGYVIEAVGEDLDKDAITTSNCHYYESYPDICVGGFPDLDCVEIEFRDFAVLRPDPYGFNLDGDGVGCPSSRYP